MKMLVKGRIVGYGFGLFDYLQVTESHARRDYRCKRCGNWILKDALYSHVTGRDYLAESADGQVNLRFHPHCLQMDAELEGA